MAGHGERTANRANRVKLYRFSIGGEHHDILANDWAHAIEQYGKFSEDNDWPTLHDVEMVVVISDEVH